MLATPNISFGAERLRPDHLELYASVTDILRFSRRWFPPSLMFQYGILTNEPKGTKLRESEEVEQIFNTEAEDSETLDSILADVTCYRGFKSAPRWTDVDEGMLARPVHDVNSRPYPEFFSTLCTVYADTSKVSRYRLSSPHGSYYRQEFKVVLSCGLTEMKAQISWRENVSPIALARRMRTNSLL